MQLKLPALDDMQIRGEQLSKSKSSKLPGILFIVESLAKTSGSCNPCHALGSRGSPGHGKGSAHVHLVCLPVYGTFPVTHITFWTTEHTVHQPACLGRRHAAASCRSYSTVFDSKIYHKSSDSFAMLYLS